MCNIVKMWSHESIFSKDKCVEWLGFISKRETLVDVRYSNKKSSKQPSALNMTEPTTLSECYGIKLNSVKIRNETYLPIKEQRDKHHHHKLTKNINCTMHDADIKSTNVSVEVINSSAAALNNNNIIDSNLEATISNDNDAVLPSTIALTSTAAFTEIENSLRNAMFSFLAEMFQSIMDLVHGRERKYLWRVRIMMVTAYWYLHLYFDSTNLVSSGDSCCAVVLACIYLAGKVVIIQYKSCNDIPVSFTLIQYFFLVLKLNLML